MIVKASRRIATRSVTFCFAAAAIFGAALVAERLAFERVQAQGHENGRAAAALAGKILLEDERMTRSTQLTGSETAPSLRTDEYKRSAEAIEKALHTASRLPSGVVRQTVDTAVRANAELEQLERRAIRLAASGRHTEANDLLRGDAYQARKATLARAAERMSDEMSAAVASELHERKQWSSLILMFLILSALTGFGVLWRKLSVSLADFEQEYRNQEDELRTMATEDPLTGLHNRRSAMDAMAADIVSAGERGTSLAVLTLDLDGFKPVNDTFGHEAGDHVLKGVAERLDVLAGGHRVARLGGDEFAIVAEVTNQDQAFELAHRIVDAIAVPFTYGDQTLEVGASVGLSVHPRDAQDPETLLRLSDIALYCAKQEGGRTVRFFKPHMRTQVRKLALDAGRPSNVIPIGRTRGGSAEVAPAVCSMFGSEVASADAPASGGIDRLLQVLREHLDMDVAFASEFTGGKRVFRHVQERRDQQTIRVGGSDPLEDSYCQRVIDGRLPELIPDTGQVPAALALPVTETLPVGAHLSVPIVLQDGRVYGTFCCFSFSPDRSLNERDMQMMRVFASLAANQIDADRGTSAKLEKIRRTRAVLDQDQLSIVCQPIYDIQQRRVEGIECLARFSARPERPPNEWFADAHDAGMGVELELTAIRKALLTLPDVPSDVYLSVNVSPETILSGHLEALLRTAPTRRVVLEITEHAAIADYLGLLRALKPLRPYVGVAIDDAGAGYSSLRHILDLRPDLIKLDMSLTHQIENDAGRRALAASLIDFAARTNAKLIAEGIETHRELEVLRSLGVQHGQGYYLSRPLPASKVGAFIKASRVADEEVSSARQPARRSA